MITKNDALAIGKAIAVGRNSELAIAAALLKETAREDLYGEPRRAGIRAGTYAAIERVWSALPNETRGKFLYNFDRYCRECELV